MINISHTLVYACLSISYAGTTIGLDKTYVGAFTALMYLLLAVDEWRKHK